MYVTPRPRVEDDPLYAVRMAAAGTLSYAAIPILDPALPPLLAALPLGLIAGQRMAFNPMKAMAGPIAFVVIVWLVGWIAEMLRPMPLVYVGAMGLTYFAGYLMILKSGAQTGMLVIVVTVLMSIMGMNSTAALETMRGAFTQAAIWTFFLMPILFAVLPPRTTERFVEAPVPSLGNVVVGAAIRAGVLLALSFWLYSVLPPSDMMMAVVAAMVLVFPTRRAVFFEASQRIRATLYGGGVALAVLAAYTLTAHFPVLLSLIFLAGLFFGSAMMSGRHPSMVYQYAFSVSLALIAGALSSQDPGYATFTRVVLTLTGAFSAAFAVALLDSFTDWRGERCRRGTSPVASHP